jgi:hypothetical protein
MKKEHYVTLFDSLFLPQGLALQQSLELHAGDYTLWILCMDDNCYDILSAIKPANTRLLKLSAIEPEELKLVKTQRSIAEYCWTVTPWTPKFVFDSDPSVARVTYLDADLWFLRNPASLFRELDESGKSVLITEHAYTPEFDESHRTGRYCVQFVVFGRDSSENVRKWWQEKCLEWCFARFEDGKFGDQKYLDDWDVRFHDQVHVLRNQASTLAPWNAARFPYSSAVFYHFHGLRILKNRITFDGYPLPVNVINNVYRPYIRMLGEKISLLRQNGFNPRAQASFPGILRIIKRKFMGIYLQAWKFNNRHTIWQKL